MKHKLLIIDDDASMCSLLSLALASDYDVESVMTAEEGVAAIKDGHGIELVLLDLRIGIADGMDVLNAIHEYDSSIPVIVMTAFGSIRSSVEAMKRGAFTYLSKPLDIDELMIFIEQGLNLHKLNEDVSFLTSELSNINRYQEIIGRSAPMQHLYGMIERLKNVDANVIILGESGTGKELAARALHTTGKRQDKRFVVINCAAIPENLLEEELFGHKRGAFTGAVQDKKGSFEVANGGTIFLDEIGDMPLVLQSKLLRVIQQKEFTPLGDTVLRHVDVRIIAATNRDLAEMVQNGSFREDLYYRLNVVTLEMPPLRERKEDIPLLCKHFIQKYNAEQNKSVKSISPEAQRLLESNDYPGNIRQLANILEYAMIFSNGSTLEVSALPLEFRREAKPAEAGEDADLPQLLAGMSIKEIERVAICAALKRNGNRRDLTAQELGISVRSLQNKIVEYDLK